MNTGVIPIALLGGAIAVAIYMGPVWDDPASADDVPTSFYMQGDCRAEIEGRVSFCSPGVVMLRVARDVTFISFERRGRLFTFKGKEWERQADGSFRVEVERVGQHSEGDAKAPYGSAQGECLVQTRGGLAGPFTVIECTAQPRGQQHRLKFRLDKITRFESGKI